MIKQLIKLIPRNKRYSIRVNNLKKADDIVIVKSKRRIVSMAFINKILFIPIITFITHRDYRRKGFASRCFNKIKQRYNLILTTVKYPNVPSTSVIQKHNFKTLLIIPWAVSIFYWVK